MVKTFVEFSNGVLDPDMKDSVTLGPFDLEYLQLTYEYLSVGPDGDNIAYFDNADGYWHLIVGKESVNGEAIEHYHQMHTDIMGETKYSDLVIFFSNAT